jgi:c-di-GMP-binding flagellar brake protein YcgR
MAPFFKDRDSGKRPGGQQRPTAPELATISPQHLGLLRRVLEQHLLIKVQIGDNRRDAYTSTILELVPEQNYLVLDELMPVDGHALLAPGTGITVHALLDGVGLEFASEVSRIGVSGGLPYYQVPLPMKLDYQQRRQEHRVAVPMNRGIKMHFQFPPDLTASGELRDLSAGGFCARLRSAQPHGVALGGLVASCRIELHPAEEIVADAKILHVDGPTTGRVPRLGASFVDLTPDIRRRIEHYVAELDRLQRRSR